MINNLMNRPAQAKLPADLDALLTRKLKATGTQLLPAEDYIKKWGYAVNKNGTVPYTN